ncbi:MAG: type II toxin-antitoxin system VapC family toxin [Candidatus Entotheonellia bacterium]
MRLLLDTHIFLWFISGDAQLPADWRDSIRDGGNEVYLSVVSIWEAFVKHRLGKLPLPHPPAHYLPAQRARHQIGSLPLDEASVCQLAALPSVHRDPFDRMLVCQAIEHGLTLVTVDPVFQAYPAPILERT